MPDTGAILWAGIGGLILLMLGVIGYLIDNGFKGLKRELKVLWDKLDGHQKLAEENAVKIAKIEARCEERDCATRGKK